MRIVLDGMGSDNYPEPEVLAAVEVAKRFGDEIFLVGQQDRLAPLLEKHNPDGAPVTLVHAAEVFEMSDKISGSALRRSENSMGVGMDLLKEGRADAFVTAGNTGGAMAIGLAMGLRSTREMMPLDHTSKASTLGKANDVYQVALLQEAHIHLVTTLH